MCATCTRATCALSINSNMAIFERLNGEGLEKKKNLSGRIFSGLDEFKAVVRDDFKVFLHPEVQVGGNGHEIYINRGSDNKFYVLERKGDTFTFIDAPEQYEMARAIAQIHLDAKE